MPNCKTKHDQRPEMPITDWVLFDLPSYKIRCPSGTPSSNGDGTPKIGLEYMYRI